MKFLFGLMFSTVVLCSPVPMGQSSPEKVTDSQISSTKAKSPKARIGDRVRMAKGVSGSKPTETTPVNSNPIATATSFLEIPMASQVNELEIPTSTSSAALSSTPSPTIADRGSTVFDLSGFQSSSQESNLPASSNFNAASTLNPMGTPVNLKIDRVDGNTPICQQCDKTISAAQQRNYSNCKMCNPRDCIAGARKNCADCCCCLCTEDCAKECVKCSLTLCCECLVHCVGGMFH